MGESRGVLARAARGRLAGVRASLAREERARRAAVWSVADTLGVLRARGVTAAGGARTYRDSGGVVHPVPLSTILAAHRRLQARAVAAPTSAARMRHR